MVQSNIGKKIRNGFFGFYIGLFLFFVFFGLWFFSSFNVVNEKDIPHEDLNLADEIEVVETELSYMEDESNYLRAVSTMNNAYCDLIVNVSRKNVCFSEVPFRVELIEDTRSESDVLDDTNLVLASVYFDSSYCELIVGVNKRNECFALFENVVNYSGSFENVSNIILVDNFSNHTYVEYS